MVIDALGYLPVIKFWGEDLAICIRIVSESKKLVIILDIIYYYRIGGGTSKFMADMMDDSITLYKYKYSFPEKYAMPQDWKLYMDIEMLNNTKTYIKSCIKYKAFSDIQLKTEVEKLAQEKNVHNAAEHLKDMQINRVSSYAQMIYANDVDAVISENQKELNANIYKDRVKNILKKLR